MMAPVSKANGIAARQGAFDQHRQYLVDTASVAGSSGKAVSSRNRQRGDRSRGQRTRR